MDLGLEEDSSDDESSESEIKREHVNGKHLPSLRGIYSSV